MKGHQNRGLRTVAYSLPAKNITFIFKILISHGGVYGGYCFLVYDAAYRYCHMLVTRHGVWVGNWI
jgi:hypothetical protein